MKKNNNFNAVNTLAPPPDLYSSYISYSLLLTNIMQGNNNVILRSYENSFCVQRKLK